MKIAILNGSPRKENTAAMVEAFAEGAREAGHEVDILHVGKMKINGCLGCEFCHTKGEGKCVQKDDMEKVMPAYLESDMIVFATPIYYFDMTAQLSAAIQRVYCIGKPAKATKAAMLISSGSPKQQCLSAPDHREQAREQLFLTRTCLRTWASRMQAYARWQVKRTSQKKSWRR